MMPYLIKLRSVKIVLIFVVLLNSCGGISDIMTNLGDGYFYYGEGGKLNYIYLSKSKHNVGVTTEEIIVHSNVEDYKYDNHHIVVKQIFNLEAFKERVADIIETNTRAFKYVDSLEKELIPIYYLELFEENQKDSTFYINLRDRISFKNTIKDQNLLNKLADSIIVSNSKYHHLLVNEINYFIIDKKTNYTYGPFDFKTYQVEYKRLNVSKNLKL